MDNLIRLYKIHSPSTRERNMSSYVQWVLKNMGVEFDVDEYHQIFKIIPGTPLLSCHMDQVGITPLRTIFNDGVKIFGDKNLGADDKNGIWIILELLKEYAGKVSFIFSVEEECGGKCDEVCSKHDISECIYGLVFDRANSGDIIGTDNCYCVEEFEQDLVALGKPFGYSSDMGTWSDADTLNDYISCVNLSVGYYLAHTDKEYTVIKELENALAFARVILNNIDKMYQKPVQIPWNYRNGNYSSYLRDDDGFGDSIFDDQDTPLCPDCMESLIDSGRVLYCARCGYSW